MSRSLRRHNSIAPPSGSTVGPPRWRRLPLDRPGQIIEAAFRVFGEHGLARARLEDVAREAGVSKGTIYLYFDGKDDLFRAVVRAKIVTAIEEAEQHLVPGVAPVEQLRAYARMNFSWVAGPVFQTMYRLVNTELPRFPELAGFYGREVIDRGLRLLSRLLENGMDRGVFRRTDPLTAARIFSSIILTHAVWFARREAFGTFADVSLESVTDNLLDFFLRAMAPGAPIAATLTPSEPAP